MNLTLRKAVESDIPYLLSLRELTMHPYLEPLDTQAITQESAIKRVRYHFECAKMIELEGKTIGLFKAKFDDSMNQWELIQIQIQIHPDYQNQSVGHHIIGMLIAQAKNTKSNIYLSVLKNNPARNLYETFGFKVIETIGDEYKMLLTFSTLS